MDNTDFADGWNKAYCVNLEACLSRDGYVSMYASFHVMW